MKKDTFILNTDLDEKTETLSDKEVGQVFRKILCSSKSNKTCFNKVSKKEIWILRKG